MRSRSTPPGRLLKRAEFQAAAGQGRRFRSAAITVQVRDRAPDASGVRLGLTASRKTGSATERNRIRRRLRAAARDAFADCAQDVDVVAVASAAALTATYADLVGTLRNALTKARGQRKQQPEISAASPHAEREASPAARETIRS